MTAYNELLEKAIIFATQKHSGQTRWNGEPYILHPLRVMNKCSDIEEKIVAVLHDVIEDTDAGYDDLYDLGLTIHHVTCVQVLTHSASETYKDYIRGIKGSICINIKIADLEDNTNIFENPGDLDDRYVRSLNKHLRALRYLKYGGSYDG